MRALTMAVTAALTLGAASAVRAAEPQPTRDYISAAEVAALQAKAKAERKDGQALLSQRLLTLAPYAANLEYRASVGPAAVHEKEAELFYVVRAGCRARCPRATCSSCPRIPRTGSAPSTGWWC